MKQVFGLTGAIAGVLLLMVGCATQGGRTIVQDRGGRFSFPAAAEFSEQVTNGDFYHYTLADPAMEIYVAAVENVLEAEASIAAINRVGIDTGELTLSGTSTFGDWYLERYDEPVPGDFTAIAYQYREGTVYAVIVDGGSDSSPDTLPASVMMLVGGVEFNSAAGSIFEPESFTDLESYVDESIDALGGSVSLAVLRGGEIVYQYATGNLDPDRTASVDAVYHWGSITKMVTATAVMQQVEDGAIDLDGTVDLYIPELVVGSSITVRNLLTHSSGLPDFGAAHLVGINGVPAPRLEEVLAWYAGRVDTLAFEPGSRSVYNNYNFLLLGVIVERTTGEDLTAYVEREIFEPLGMRHTSYSSAGLPAGTVEAHAVIAGKHLPALLEQVEPAGIALEAIVSDQTDGRVYLSYYDILPCWGGLKSTAEDALRFASLFMNNGVSNENRILERRSVRLMLTMQRSNDRSPLGLGLGCFLSRDGYRQVVEHAGGGPGIESLLRFYPREDLAVVALGSVTGYAAGRTVDYMAELARQQ
jgi:CubicO group peptidase (beta-lactamase class C family)